MYHLPTNKLIASLSDRVGSDILQTCPHIKDEKASHLPPRLFHGLVKPLQQDLPSATAMLRSDVEMEHHGIS
jgi:hypothetical protein